MFVAAAALLWLPAIAQETPRRMTAREMFYAVPEKVAPPAAPVPARTARPRKTAVREQPAPTRPVPAPAPEPAEVVRVGYVPDAAARPLGLKYTLLKREGDGAVEVSPDAVFHAGDRIRLKVEANDAGYLYIVSRGSSGTWKPMFPAPEIEDGNNRLPKDREVVMPPGNVFTFVGEPGEEKLFVLFSRAPEPDIERLIYDLKGEPAPAREERPAPTLLVSARPIPDATVDGLRVYARDLIIEKAEDAPAAGRKSEKSVYVVDPRGARVVADISLKHR